MNRETTQKDGKGNIPELGFRNYWYPTVRSRSVNKKPVHVRLLGQDLVLFRSQGRIVALQGKCPHRGMPLWLGKSHFPGTLSCPYHGWTFDGTGRCVAALLEGPTSSLPPKVCIQSYPVQERWGVVWIYVGETLAPSLEEDLPPALLRPNIVVCTDIQDWACNWRVVIENFMDPLHALYVHRSSLLMLFDMVLSSARLEVRDTDDGRGFHLEYGGNSYQDTYPGLGKYPRRWWWRRWKARLLDEEKFWEQGFFAEVRLPSNTSVNLPGGVTYVQYVVPKDRGETRSVAFTIVQARGLAALKFKFLYYLLFHWMENRGRYSVLGQDQVICENQDYAYPEKLSATDVGIIRWRREAHRRARGADGETIGAPASSLRQKTLMT